MDLLSLKQVQDCLCEPKCERMKAAQMSRLSAHVVFHRLSNLQQTDSNSFLLMINRESDLSADCG